MVTGAFVSAQAQYPGHIKKDTDTTPPLRATGVFEWTGDLSKPKAGRLIPIAVWDGQQYQPGGLYLAQPAPITVYSGTVYELQQAGAPKGLFQVSGAENLGGSWIAIGSVKPEVLAPRAKPPMSKHPPQVVKDTGSDSDRPTLHRKAGSDSGDSGSSSGSGTGNGTGSSSGTSSADPDRPTLHRRDSGDSSSSGSGSGSGSGSSGGGDSGSAQNPPSVDPDRPTLHRKDSGNSSSSGGGSNAPSVDPDRPTLHKRTDKAANDAGGPVSATANIDPDRPKLRYGKPETLEGTVAPSKLEGLPMDMNQMAAISDAKPGEQHLFVYSWADPADAAKMQAAMEDMARKALAGKQASPSTVTKAVTKSTTSAVARHKAAAQPTPPALELADEKFNAFELSYSGGATLVFTAKTAGEGDSAKYVTLIAQPDFYGVPQVVFQQVTSDDRLEITPQMRLVDAADTDADHRAELIFELRGKTGRSFAIYRVVNRRVEEAFNTGPVP